MFPKIDVSSYLRPASEDDAAIQPSENGAAVQPKHDPTYSTFLGSGFGNPKLLKPASQSDQTRP